MIIIFIFAAVDLLNSSVLPAVLAIVGVVYFVWTYYRANQTANRNRKEIQQAITNKTTVILPQRSYFVASAGSKESNACEKISAVDIESCNFCDSKGRPLNLSLYNCFVVHGDSMKYAGINDDDFIFVTKGFSTESLTSFPEILVLNTGKPKLANPCIRFAVLGIWAQLMMI